MFHTARLKDIVVRAHDISASGKRCMDFIDARGFLMTVFNINCRHKRWQRSGMDLLSKQALGSCGTRVSCCVRAAFSSVHILMHTDASIYIGCAFIAPKGWN